MERGSGHPVPPSCNEETTGKSIKRSVTSCPGSWRGGLSGAGAALGMPPPMAPLLQVS